MNNTTAAGYLEPQASAFLVPLCPELAAPALESWAFHASHSFAFILLYLCADLAAKKALPDANARWFALHALANIITAGASLRDLASVLSRPMCGMVSPILSWVPTHAGIAIHIYHCIGFWSYLRADDIVHHVVFGGGMGLLNFLLPWGRVTNALLFFITGVPGGITYIMLVLVKMGKMQYLTEKAISASINTWMRTPGLTWFSTVILACLMHGALHVPTWAACLCIGLAFLNGVYYGEQALSNFVTRKTEMRERESAAARKLQGSLGAAAGEDGSSSSSSSSSSGRSGGSSSTSGSAEGGAQATS